MSTAALYYTHAQLMLLCVFMVSFLQELGSLFHLWDLVWSRSFSLHGKELWIWVSWEGMEGMWKERMERGRKRFKLQLWLFFILKPQHCRFGSEEGMWIPSQPPDGRWRMGRRLCSKLLHTHYQLIPVLFSLLYLLPLPVLWKEEVCPE